MDWNLKATSWDLSGLEQEAVRNVGAFDKSTGLGDHRSGRDFSIDLKLGRVGNLSDQAINMAKQPGVPKMESLSPSGSTKRARAGNNGTQVVSCLVDGCNSDLSNCRDYHRRHKVCELHSKTPQVTIRGHKRRFCQQCSRFHALEEFDEGKRSCRKRLDGHNRRRRKPQPDPLSRPASYLSSYRAECSFNNFSGSQMLQFSGSHVYPSTTVVNPTWSRVVSPGADSRHGNLQLQVQLPAKQSLFLGSSLSIYKGEKQFPFLPADTSTNLCNQIPSEASVCQPLLRTVALSESSRGGSSSSMFCDRLTTQVRSADCALSLLSSTQTQTSGNNVAQAINPSLEYHSLEPIDAVLVSSGRDADEHCPGMFHMSSGASSGNKAPQTLPFAWD